MRWNRLALKPIETDLGEYIIQLAGETPSHIVIPAIHKNRYQIAELLIEGSGRNSGAGYNRTCRICS